MRNFNSNFIVKVFILILPLSFYGQTVINDVVFYKIPLDMQLVARDLSSNKGVVTFEGQVDFEKTHYYDIQIQVLRDGVVYGNSPYNYHLVYTDNIALFKFNLKIDAELANYTFNVYGLGVDSRKEISTVKNIVAGDVYIIQGQSNAEARKYEGSANGDTSPYIRVYSSGTEIEDVLFDNDYWYEAQGDGRSYTDGNAGQWGLKLAKMLIDSVQIPIAVFNGAKGGRDISYFQKNNRNQEDGITNNYERLYYRLNKTGLKEAVKAVFWAQGDNTGYYENYEDLFLNIRDSWFEDFINIKKIYIFQTRNGCNTNSERKEMIKEAQRKLAAENSDIHIMSTDGLKQYDEGGSNGYCHYFYTNGYKDFATRIFNLVKRDFYDGKFISDIEPPNILKAYFIDETTLIVETDAVSLNIDELAENNFEIHNSLGDIITDFNVSVLNNKIIFKMLEFSGIGSTISNLGNRSGISDKFIYNSTGLEMVNFYKLVVNEFNSSSLGIAKDKMEDNFTISNSVNRFNIKASQIVSKFKVYDLLGRLFIEYYPNEKYFELNSTKIKKGVILIIEVTFENGNVIHKKHLKF